MKSVYFKNGENQNKKVYKKGSIQWIPPRSPYNLIQELLYHDPWKLLVSTIFLQKSSGKSAIPIFWEFIKKYSTPEDIINEDIENIKNLILCLGLQEKRAAMFKKFSEEFLKKKWKYPIELHGIGKYGNDSYRIFCTNEWRLVQPTDSKLILYHSWLQNNMHLLQISE